MKKLKDLLNEVLPKFKTPFEAYDWVMNRRAHAIDIEMDMMTTNKEIQQLYVAYKVLSSQLEQNRNRIE